MEWTPVGEVEVMREVCREDVQQEVECQDRSKCRQTNRR